MRLLRYALGCLALATPLPAFAAVFIVDSTVDAVDATPGDGVCASAGDGCTLRAAIQESNALGGADEIDLPAGTYQIAIAGLGETAGSLDIIDDLAIRGAGAQHTILDGAQLDTVLGINSSSLELSGVTVQNAPLGISWSSGDDTLLIMDSTVRTNGRGLVADCRGGGASVFVQGTSFVANDGVGAAFTFCRWQVANSTFSGNSLGLWTESSAGRVVSSTISFNTTGILHFCASGRGCSRLRPYMGGTVVSDNGTDCWPGGADSLLSIGYNIDSDGSCGLTETTDFSSTDPLLGTLQDNGGPTRTLALLPGSPALDAIPLEDCAWDDDGDPNTPEVPLLYDQRGVERPQGTACDIGAVEIAQESVCGNGAREGREECDDGNTTAGDGCSDMCIIEFCGDGSVQAGIGEQCEDGNATLGDGCEFCAFAPLASCLAAAKGSLTINEKKPEDEKLTAFLKGFDGATAQSDFGNPVSDNTWYDLRLFDGAGGLVGELLVDRAGDPCGAKSKDCWKARGQKGWIYKDPDASADGVKKIGIVSGAEGKGKVQVLAGNKEKKGQMAMPVGIAAALQNETSVTIQVRAKDEICVEATLTNVKKANEEQFKAKAP